MNPSKFLAAIAMLTVASPCGAAFVAQTAAVGGLPSGASQDQAVSVYTQGGAGVSWASAVSFAEAVPEPEPEPEEPAVTPEEESVTEPVNTGNGNVGGSYRSRTPISETNTVQALNNEEEQDDLITVLTPEMTAENETKTQTASGDSVATEDSNSPAAGQLVASVDDLYEPQVAVTPAEQVAAEEIEEAENEVLVPQVAQMEVAETAAILSSENGGQSEDENRILAMENENKKFAQDANTHYYESANAVNPIFEKSNSVVSTWVAVGVTAMTVTALGVTFRRRLNRKTWHKIKARLAPK